MKLKISKFNRATLSPIAKNLNLKFCEIASQKSLLPSFYFVKQKQLGVIDLCS